MPKKMLFESLISLGPKKKMSHFEQEKSAKPSVSSQGDKTEIKITISKPTDEWIDRRMVGTVSVSLIHRSYSHAPLHLSVHPLGLVLRDSVIDAF